MVSIINLAHFGVTKPVLPARDMEDVDKIVIHRIDVGESAEDVASFFKKKEPQWTGGYIPYHFIIKRDGHVEQLAPLSRKAQGARKLNNTGIQIALVGDFRTKPATPYQAESLVRLVGLLCNALHIYDIVGHTEVPGASHDPDKDCPGSHLNLDGLRASVKNQCFELSAEESLAMLSKSGVNW